MISMNKWEQVNGSWTLVLTLFMNIMLAPLQRCPYNDLSCLLLCLGDDFFTEHTSTLNSVWFHFQRRWGVSERRLRLSNTFISATARKPSPHRQQCRDTDWSLVLCGLPGHQDSWLVTWATFASLDWFPREKSSDTWRVQHDIVLQRWCTVSLQWKLSWLGLWVVTHLHLQKPLPHQGGSFYHIHPTTGA